MKLTILKHYLNESIQHVSKAISTKTTIPILSGIKIDATHQGVTITGSDTEISIQSFIPSKNEDVEIIQLYQIGSVVLPAKFLIEIIKKLPAELIEIESSADFKTTIRSGSSEVQLVGLDPDEYPLLPQIETNKVITLASDLLKNMIRQTSYAVSTSETTPILTGVLWCLTDQSLKMVACDRHRLATRETELQFMEEQMFNNIVISGKTLNELNRILPDQNTLVDIAVTNNQVLFKLHNILFYSRILEGTYPDTSKLISQTFQTEILIPSKQLIEAIDRAYLLSREEKTNIVKLIMLDNQTIEISSSLSELGKVTETIPVENVIGELLKISFNSKYMLDALKVLDSEFIRLKFTGAMSPIIILPEDGTNLLQLILPYRTTN